MNTRFARTRERVPREHGHKSYENIRTRATNESTIVARTREQELEEQENKSYKNNENMKTRVTRT
jgi:hypothetical protein